MKFGFGIPMSHVIYLFNLLLVMSLGLTLIYITFVMKVHRESRELMALPRHIAEQIVNMRLQLSILKQTNSECVIPKTDPFHKTVMRFDRSMSTLPKINCNINNEPDWVHCHRSECYVISEILNLKGDVSCSYRDIIYINDRVHHVGDSFSLFGAEIYKLIRSDHVKVSCSGRTNGSILEQIVPSKWFGYKAGFRDVERENVDLNATIDVLILAFDSASHNGFIRRMPKSYKVLKDELKTTILNGYNIVGDGTPAALFPLFTGRTEFELPDVRINATKNNRQFDRRYLIFHSVRKMGYRTAYFEDMPWIGTFQYRFNGFNKQPADHYLRALLLEESKFGKKWWQGLTNRYCFGSSPQYAWMLDLTEQFFKLDGKHFCFTMIADICHDDFNMISVADDDLVRWLRRFRDGWKLNNTLLIVMGDHGARYTDVRQTYQGMLEERLPFMAIHLPQTLLKERPEALRNLKKNINVLTTPFDVYATILDVMNQHRTWLDYKVPGSHKTRAMSLLKPIPANRTCGEAGILPHWCACAAWRPVSSKQEIYKKIVNALVEFINKQTLFMRNKCVERKLILIKSVSRHGVSDEALTRHKHADKDGLLPEYDSPQPVAAPLVHHYRARVVLSPNNALYDGTLEYYSDTGTFEITDRAISRINSYESDPWCIIESYPHLDKYCYCVKKLPAFNLSLHYQTDPPKTESLIFNLE